ncbi:VQ motif-containing protein 1-like [Malania oleifera]|uniref:VQ motif-containing protein 1-like n=1 Tax=Malania oleifera TaxID=397392 RepID=UPI0025AEA7C6|nr:VQ motif-containing protein 1-like [Malania oleifera]
MSRRAAKVVFISTQYVETDALSFKSVVQRLTGKHADEVEAEVAHAPPSGSGIRKEMPPDGGLPSNIADGFRCSTTGNHSYSGLTRDFSFREFDRLLMQLPPLDQFDALLWADD